MDRLITMEALVRVADAGNFSAAARRWGRSKAVVSKYVSSLEQRLGVQLLRRTTRSLGLTGAGRAYVERCRALLAELDELEANLDADRAALRGPLRVTAPPGFAGAHLLLMTRDFLDAHPQVTIELDLTHRMVDLVEEGFDLAIRVTDPPDSSLIARRLGPAPIVAVASPGYLAARGTPATPEDLRDHDCLVDTNFRDQQRWRFEVGGRPRTIAVSGPVRANSPAAIREFAAAGCGIALCPRFAVAAALESGALVEVLAGAVAIEWSILAVYPRRRYQSARVRAYVDHLAAALAG
jgi:DNA-binding transcriptional LysR family regulator